jgi:hypothetical protein
MNSLQIYVLIVGLLMIACCVLYARTNKFNGRNNLPFLTLCGIVSIAITTLGIIYPSWWILCIMCYCLFFLNTWGDTAEQKDIRKEYQYKKWYRTKSFQISMIILGRVTLITEFIISVIMAMTCGWLVALFYSPIAILSLLIMSVETKRWLEKL